MVGALGIPCFRLAGTTLLSRASTVQTIDSISLFVPLQKSWAEESTTWAATRCAKSDVG